MCKRIIRVFPRKTKATPTDDMVRINVGPGLFDAADEIHVSVTFTWDLPRAKELAYQWEPVAPVKIGGPATGEAGGDFAPGRYLKDGYVITSRGCPNKCWFCDVWKREGTVRELPIQDGWNILDDNILATSDKHFAAVADMLSRQSHQPEFTGGLEAKRLTLERAVILKELKVKQVFFAYDRPDALEPLVRAVGIMVDAGFKAAKSHALRCFVLIGYPRDTFDDAEMRLRQVMDLGVMPMAMLYRDHVGQVSGKWKQFQREWANPFILGSKMNALKDRCSVDKIANLSSREEK